MPEEMIQENINTEEPKKKKGKFKIMLIIILCVVCLGLAGTYFLYGNVLIERFTGKEKSEEQKKEVKKAEVPTGPIMSLEPFLFKCTWEIRQDFHRYTV